LDIFGYFLPFKPTRCRFPLSNRIWSRNHRAGFLDYLAVIFRSFAKSDDPDALLKRIVRWLLRGSLLELLVAVPSHIIVRRRDDCCAPLGTFWGIATGISVMLLCFGPGVFFLFVERCQRLKPKPQATTKIQPRRERNLVENVSTNFKLQGATCGGHVTWHTIETSAKPAQRLLGREPHSSICWRNAAVCRPPLR